MIGTYIQELLANNNRVIIPNYGAFLVRATSKSKDANTLKEKLADIYFSPFLKFNDELLEKHIIKKEGVTKEIAAEKIKQYIDDIKKELDQDKPFKIENFGEFTADKQGKVVFTTVGKAKEVKPEEKKETTAKAATKKEPEVKTTKKAKETITEEKKTQKPVTPVKETESPKEEKKEEEKSTGLKEFKPEEKTEIQTKKAEKPVYNLKKEKKPVNKALIWTIAISVPVAAIFIWGILNISTVKEVLTKDKDKTEKLVKKPVAKKKVAPKKTETKPEAEEVKKQQAKQEVITEKKPLVPQKKYYIIAGSFKNETYAISYLNKLKAEGYNAEKLAVRNGMHAVSFSSFADKRKAIAEYKFITQEKGLQAWILYY